MPAEEDKTQNQEEIEHETSKPEAAPKQPEETSLVKEIPQDKSSIKTAVIVILILIAGVGSGYFLSTIQGEAKKPKSTKTISESGLEVGEVYGNPDKETFRDEAEGVLVKGGVDGEGSYHLMRPGGESQNVYLTSSVVDLDLFTDNKIKVWGETFSAQKAGWLMDVGRVEVIELNAEKPFEE